MTTTLKIQCDDKYEFGAISGLWGFEDGVLIPIGEIESLSNEEIGAYFRRIVPFVHKAQAEAAADYILHGLSTNYLTIEQIKEYLSRVDGVDMPDSKKAAELLRGILSRKLERQQYKQRSKKIRAELARNYREIFNTLVERDGHCCTNCGEDTRYLTIDHKKAVINGGTNDIDNLQLLCRSCNSKKSDSE